MGADAAGVVLMGGRSTRMGTAKADLEWHGSTLLYRAAALLRRAVDGPVIVVGAAGQAVPVRPPEVEVVVDPVPGRGPLQGIAAGVAAVARAAPSVTAVFVCSTDLPFLHPAFVRRVARTLEDPALDVALPVARGYRQPLAAAYRTTLAEPITALLAEGGRAPGMLFARCRVAVLDDATLLADPEIARLDPDLASLTNVNTPADYALARARTPEPVVVTHAGRRHVVAAATLGAVTHAVGVTPADVTTTVNGRPVPTDARLPLVAGDSVALRDAHCVFP